MERYHGGSIGTIRRISQANQAYEGLKALTANVRFRHHGSKQNNGAMGLRICAKRHAAV